MTPAEIDTALTWIGITVAFCVACVALGFILGGRKKGGPR